MLTAYQSRRSKTDRKVLRAAWQLGYKAGLETLATAADDPYVGRIEHFSAQWQQGFKDARADLRRGALEV